MWKRVQPRLPDIASFVRSLVHGDGGVHGREGAGELQRQARGRQARHVRHGSPAAADASSRARHRRQEKGSRDQQETNTAHTLLRALLLNAGARSSSEEQGCAAAGEEAGPALITAAPAGSSRPAGPVWRRPSSRNPCREREASILKLAHGVVVVVRRRRGRAPREKRFRDDFRAHGRDGRRATHVHQTTGRSK